MSKLKKLTWLIILTIAASGLFVAGVYAQSDDDANTQTDTVVEVPDELATPRNCFETYQNAMNRLGWGASGALDDALSTFDLTGIPAPILQQYGEEVVWKLHGIIKNIPDIDSSAFSDDPTGIVIVDDAETVPLAILFTDIQGLIEITRGDDGAWRFGMESVQAILNIYHAMEMSGDYEFDSLPEISIPSEIPQELTNPRSCYAAYHEAMLRAVEEEPGVLADAAVCLDLSGIPQIELEEQKEDYTRQLWRILETIPEIDPETISDDLSGPPIEFLTHEKGLIEINLSPDGAWRFSRTSVLAIPEIYFSMVEAGAIRILETVETADEVPQELATPRSCYVTFFNAMKAWNEGESEKLNDAIDCLDLSDIPGGVRHEYSRDIAKKLGEILDHITKVDPENIPHDPEGPLATIYDDESGTIKITRSEDQAWRFSAQSIQDIPNIYRAMDVSGVFQSGISRNEISGGAPVQDLGLTGLIPASWKDKTFLIEDWQWLFLILIILIGLVIERLVPILVRQLLNIWLRRTVLKDWKDLANNTSRPFGFLAMAAFWWIVLGGLGLDVKVLVVLLTAAKFMTAWGIVWCFYRAVDIVSELIEHKASETESRMDDLLGPFVRKSLKVLVAIFGIIFVASNVDINVSSLLAGLGIGGIAIALAAKDTLENFLGSITVLFDRPFQVGDWVIIGDVEGTVEEVGFRSTRVRTFYNSMVTVPNSKLVSSEVDNLGVREFRRIKTMISVTYDTPPDKIDAFCEGIRELILTHPYTRKDYFHVYFNQFSGSSLDILLYCFLRTPEWGTELRERHRLFLDILRLGQELGIEFAFPTQTIHMGKERPPQPVFPGEGDIKTAVDTEKADAGRRAKKITESELGGKGTIPDPVDFGDKWADDGGAGDG